MGYILYHGKKDPILLVGRTSPCTASHLCVIYNFVPQTLAESES